jgi:hypothetical protein
VRLGLHAGTDVTTIGDCFGPWDANHYTVVVKHWNGSSWDTWTENTQYRVDQADNAACLKVSPKYGYGLLAGDTITVRFWGKITKVATKRKVYHKPGQICLLVESRETATVDGTATGAPLNACTDGGHNDYEFLNAYIADRPGLTVKNQANVAAFLVVPPLVVAWESTQSEAVEVEISALDLMGNGMADPPYTGTITLASAVNWIWDGGQTPATSHQVTFASGDEGKITLTGVRFLARPAGHYVWLDVTSPSAWSISSAVSLDDSPPYRILVGDPHAHTNVDHRGNFIDPEAVYYYGLFTACLDWMVGVDHGWCWYNDCRWTPRELYQRQVVRALKYTTSKKTALRGGEWTRGQASSGCDVPATEGQSHHNFFDRPPQVGLFHSGFSCRALRTEDALVAKLNASGLDYVLYPHPMHGKKNWAAEDPPHPNEPVAEIISYKAAMQHDMDDKTQGEFLPYAWPRCFELPGKNLAGVTYSTTQAYEFAFSLRYLWGFQDAMKRVIGVYGGTDSHIERSGCPNWEGTGIYFGTSAFYQRGGLTHVLTDGQGGGPIFDGFKAKRTYASSGVRFHLEFSLTINGQTIPMGQAVSLAAGTYPYTVNVRLGACANLRKVDVYRSDPTQYAGEMGDGWALVKRWSKRVVGDPLYGGARSLEATATGSITLNATDNHFSLYLFGQQDEGTDTDLGTSPYSWSYTSPYYKVSPSVARPLGGLELDEVPLPEAGQLSDLHSDAKAFFHDGTDLYVAGFNPTTLGAGHLFRLSYGGNGVWASPITVQLAA